MLKFSQCGIPLFLLGLKLSHGPFSQGSGQNMGNSSEASLPPSPSAMCSLAMAGWAVPSYRLRKHWGGRCAAEQSGLG